MGIQKLAIEKIRLDGGTQSRSGLNSEVAEGYADDMRNGAVFPAVEVMFDGSDYWLVNGFHRIEAAKLAGLLLVDADVSKGTQRDAWMVSRRANKDNGLHRTNADKRYAVESMLLDEECVRWTDGRIADTCAVGQALVSRVRSELVASQLIIEIDDRLAVRGDGEEYIVNTSKIGGKTKPKPQSAEPEPSRTWDEHYFTRDRGDAKVVFMQLADTPSVWLAAGDDAEIVADFLGAETTYLDDQGGNMLKLAHMDDRRHEQLERWINGRVDTYLEGDRELIIAAVQLPPVPFEFPDVDPASTQPIKPSLAEVWQKAKSIDPASVVICRADAQGREFLFFGEDAQRLAKTLKSQVCLLRNPVTEYSFRLQVQFYELVDLLKAHQIPFRQLNESLVLPELKAIAATLPVGYPGFVRSEEEKAAATNTLVDHPDRDSEREAARASIFGDTPLRSSEGFPIPGAPQRSDGSAPTNGSRSAPTHDPATPSGAPTSDRTEIDRQTIKRLQSDNLKLLQDKNALNDQIDDLTAQLAALEAQLAGTPLGLPADADPLREHLLRSLWYLDQGMASLAADRSLGQPDNLILKYCDDQSVRTTMQHYQIIERLLADDTIDVIREIAQNADQPKQAVEKALYEINKQEARGGAR